MPGEGTTYGRGKRLQFDLPGAAILGDALVLVYDDALGCRSPLHGVTRGLTPIGASTKDKTSRRFALRPARPARRLHRPSQNLPHLASECGPGRAAGKGAPLRSASHVTGCAGPFPPPALSAQARARQV